MAITYRITVNHQPLQQKCSKSYERELCKV